MATALTQPLPPSVVIDTNVVLDLLLFDDPRSRWLRQVLTAGQATWLATEPMLAELADVLARPFASGRSVPAAEVLRVARSACLLLPEPDLSSPRAPRCADPDDQKFADLAWATRSRWLFSRDRALLALARPAQGLGLTICTPANGHDRWTAAG